MSSINFGASASRTYLRERRFFFSGRAETMTPASRRRRGRGRGVDISWRSRGGAAAATWMFRGEESRRRVATPREAGLPSGAHRQRRGGSPESPRPRGGESESRRPMAETRRRSLSRGVATTLPRRLRALAAASPRPVRGRLGVVTAASPRPVRGRLSVVTAASPRPVHARSVSRGVGDLGADRDFAAGPRVSLFSSTSDQSKSQTTIVPPSPVSIACDAPAQRESHIWRGHSQGSPVFGRDKAQPLR